ncbi:MAG: PAS domain S-box protein, partial [Candidatus Tenebribacter burtonii]|nr:PAS domain S-box protein [Candidatus Tenebribacter burtonii]
MKTLKILMLEDNQLDADLIREELTENKFDFTSELVETEKDFIKAIHDFKPDIILSDYTLPQFNGMEAIILTKEISPLVPVIIVTGLINEEIAVECIKAGAMDYVLKENLIRLGPAITQVLEKKALIKARIKTEEALRESEKRLRSFFENSIMGIYRTTAQGDILSANPALLRMLGYSCFEELKTRNLEKEGYETGYERSIFKKNLEKNGKVVGLESAWTRKDGSTIFIRESSIAVKDDENNVLHYEGTVEDITEHKKAEKVQLVLYNIAKAVNTTKNLDQLYHTIHHLLGNI